MRKDVRKGAIKIGIGSFVAGGGLTFLITLLVHPLHTTGGCTLTRGLSRCTADLSASNNCVRLKSC